MPSSQAELHAEFVAIIERRGLDAAAAGRVVGKSRLWVWRRIQKKTRVQLDDFNLVLEKLT